MTNEGRLIDGIADTLQRVYGDATQTFLDRQAAREIWKWLRKQGIATPQEVAVVVEAAGGEVRVTQRGQVDDRPIELIVGEAFDDKVIRARRLAA